MRVINQFGEQVGLMATRDALRMAEEAELDLVEIVPNASPPVCKVMDYGKYRYDQTKREKESKKASQQIKVKELKCKPNIDDHDLQTKLRQARDFLGKGCKVKVTCMFRGREMVHTEIGERLVKSIIEALAEDSMVESPPKLFGRFYTAVLAPSHKKKKRGTDAGEKDSA